MNKTGKKHKGVRCGMFNRAFNLSFGCGIQTDKRTFTQFREYSYQRLLSQRSKILVNDVMNLCSDCENKLFNLENKDLTRVRSLTTFNKEY